MKKLATFLLILSLTGCNLPTFGPAATPTATVTATLPPSPTPTQPPPTETPTVPAATNTPEVSQPTPPAEAAPTQAPTATQPPATAVVPTVGVPVPVSRALFDGVFPGGRLSFRIGELSSRVIPKTVTLKGAECKEGGKLNDSISFEPPPSFVIDQGKFTMTQGDQVTISGQFLSSTRAAGTITLRLRGGGKACTVGPLSWTANADGG